ncbi:MAG: ribosomal-processing cysteine protease Prp [Turicibacter sp.]|nr:ribosomal-processing cysteine protease Prp [Turicibacter sp.]
MIRISVERHNHYICGFKVTEHGKNEVCAAVSLFTINTVNSIETLTDSRCAYDYDPDGGFLEFNLLEYNEHANLLLNAMLLGLRDVERNYGNEIFLEEFERSLNDD